MQVTFTSGWTALLNRQNFEWNANPFSEMFKETQNATDFIGLFREKAIFDPQTGYMALSPLREYTPDEADHMDDMATPSQEGEDDSQTPGHKRTQSGTTGPPNKARKPADDQFHINPLDDAILAKRVGMSMWLVFAVSNVSYCAF